MNAKHNLCFYVTVFLLLVGQLPAAMAVTIEELANICEKMESAIVDISLEYEWLTIPHQTFEEAEAEMGVEVLIPKDGRRMFELSAAGLLFNRDPNDPNSPPLPDRFLLEESATIITNKGNSWDNITKQSYNGKIGKYLNIGGWPRKVSTASISQKRPDISTILTPLGFSVLRFRICEVTNRSLISHILRDYKELVHLDNTVKNINGFNTVRADLLRKYTKQVCIRVYFSVDHGYTPVRYEYLSGRETEIALSIDIHSLEKIAEGLWFPSTGTISSSDSERVGGYIVTSKIVVNQGLTEKDFDIDFPPGTKVQNEITGEEYVVKPESE